VQHNLSVGIRADLPGNWKADLDYTWGQNLFSYFANNGSYDSNVANFTASTPTIIRDVLANPIPVYNAYSQYNYPSTVNDLTLKASGPLPKLWAGTPDLTAEIEQRQQGDDTGYIDSYWSPGEAQPITTTNSNSHSVYPGQGVIDKSVAAELQFPLVQRSNGIPGVQDLSLQLAGRLDNYHEYITSPVSYNYLYNNFTHVVTPATVIAPGGPGPASEVNHYNASNDTVALKYSPVDGLILRWSYSGAFVPPTFSQLQVAVPTSIVNDPSPYPGVPTSGPYSYTSVTDPLRGNATYYVPVKSGGNPNLKPETSRDIDWGVIVQPKFIPGLRVSLDYEKITKYDDIVSPSAAVLLQYYSLFPGRIIRGPNNAGDPSGYSGPITQIDATALNAAVTITATYNAQVDYTLKTERAGTWVVSGTGSMWQHDRIQTAVGTPLIENLSNPNVTSSPAATLNGSALGLPKAKGTVSLDWSMGPWGAGWLARYTGPYTIGSSYGIGGANSEQQTINGWVSGQIYHDGYLRYRWGRATPGASFWARALANTSLQFGIKNVFNHLPPYDATGVYSYYVSPYGDIRLRTYYFSYKKSF
jgi:hypothetical protein